VTRGASRHAAVASGSFNGSQLLEGTASTNSTASTKNASTAVKPLLAPPRRLHRSLLETALGQGGLQLQAPIWLQVSRQRARVLLAGMTTIDFVLVVMGIIFATIGASYFAVAYMYGNNEPEEDLPPIQPSKRRSTTSARLTPVSTQKYHLGIPSIYEAPKEHSKASKFEIKDADGHKLLAVEVMRPHQSEAEAAESDAPHEYVSIHSKAGDQELAMCALAPSGGKWECHIYQSGGGVPEHRPEHYGALVQETDWRGGMKFALVSKEGERLLVAAGQPLERRLTVFDQRGQTSAKIEPGTFSWGRPDEYYKAECSLGVDVGLVVLMLLAIDRLLSHGPEDKGSKRSSQAMVESI